MEIIKTNDIKISLPSNIEGAIESNSTVNLGFAEHVLSQAYIPGVLLSAKKTENPTFKLKHIETDSQKLEEDDSTINVYDSWGDEIPLGIHHMLYTLSRRAFLEQKLFPVHAACIGNDNGYYLIVGHSGIGKTTMTLESIDKHGMRLYSGNKTLISFTPEMKAIAGTKTSTIREADYEKFQHLMKEQLSYWGRCAFTLDEAMVSKEAEVKIKAIILPKLNERVQEFTKVKEASALHTLYPFFMDAVNAETIFGDTVLLGTAPEGTQDYLVKALLQSLNETPFYTITGTMEFIINQMKSL